jgi:hypothetical protein
LNTSQSVYIQVIYLILGRIIVKMRGTNSCSVRRSRRQRLGRCRAKTILKRGFGERGDPEVELSDLQYVRGHECSGIYYAQISRPDRTFTEANSLAENRHERKSQANTVPRGDHVELHLASRHHQPQHRMDNEPVFPAELEREIFEMTAVMHPKKIPKLLLVARRIHIWSISFIPSKPMAA